MIPFSPKVVLSWLELFWGTMLLLILQSCSNTQLGQQLAKSFDSPVNSSLQESGIKSPENTKAFAEDLPVKKAPKQRTQMISKKRSKSKPEPPVIPRNPRPYRITIKLSEADPSAPAEAVTKALRMAGVIFEVEMIERLNSQPSQRVSGRGKDSIR